MKYFPTLILWFLEFHLYFMTFFNEIISSILPISLELYLNRDCPQAILLFWYCFVLKNLFLTMPAGIILKRKKKYLDILSFFLIFKHSSRNFSSDLRQKNVPPLSAISIHMYMYVTRRWKSRSTNPPLSNLHIFYNTVTFYDISRVRGEGGRFKRLIDF